MPAAIQPQGRRAVFFDRDGTLNVEKTYLYRQEDWAWLPGAVEAIRSVNEFGFEVVVVTNQAGISRGLNSETDVTRLHAWVSANLAECGARVDAYYICPHHPNFSGPSECRKPNPGLLQKAAIERSIDLGRSFLVGDKVTDIEAAVAAGCEPMLVASGYGESARTQVPSHVAFLASLHELPQILRQRHSPEGMK